MIYQHSKPQIGIFVPNCIDRNAIELHRVFIQISLNFNYWLECDSLMRRSTIITPLNLLKWSIFEMIVLRCILCWILRWNLIWILCGISQNWIENNGKWFQNGWNIWNSGRSSFFQNLNFSAVFGENIGKVANKFRTEEFGWNNGP